jgi:ankyrin repeat protein
MLDRFLLAPLYLDTLKGKISVKSVRSALADLQARVELRKTSTAPGDKKNPILDSAFSQALQRIKMQIGDWPMLAKRTLAWITWSKGPLKAPELQEALSVEPGSHELDTTNSPTLEDMVSSCTGLVTLNKESDPVTFGLVHYSTQEYLQDGALREFFPEGEREMAITCISYLLFDTFNTGLCQTDRELDERRERNPLFDYAAQNWGDFARRGDFETENLDLILELLSDEARVAAISQALMARPKRKYRPDYVDHGFSQELPKQVAKAHLAAYFGLGKTLTALLANGENVDVKDSYGQTSLSWAVENDHSEVVKPLIDHGAEVDFRYTPYGPHAKLGIFPPTIDHFQYDAYRSTGSYEGNGWRGCTYWTKRSPLSRAAEMGREKVVKVLLENGANPNFKDTSGVTPLSRAVQVNCQAIVNLLLAHGAIVDLKDVNGRTPLSKAAEHGHESIAKILLNKNADPNSKDKNDWTPLFWAAAKGQEQLVELLIGKCQDVDTKEMYYGLTPLSYAASKGHEGVVRILLDSNKVKIDSRTTGYWNEGWTALDYAASQKYEGVVRLLREKDPTISLTPKTEIPWNSGFWGR